MAQIATLHRIDPAIVATILLTFVNQSYNTAAEEFRLQISAIVNSSWKGKKTMRCGVCTVCQLCIHIWIMINMSTTQNVQIVGS